MVALTRSTAHGAFLASQHAEHAELCNMIYSLHLPTLLLTSFCTLRDVRLPVMIAASLGAGWRPDAAFNVRLPPCLASNQADTLKMYLSPTG